ncbi:MAG: hypothetical protein ACXWP5_14950 [Bdellovibrionota bacterium]
MKRIACLRLSPAFSERDFQALAESCLRFSPQLAVRAGEAVFLDITKCRALFSEETLRARLTRLARRYGKSEWEYRVAFAESAPAASVAALYPGYGATRNLAELPLEALLDYASPFGVDLDIHKRVTRMIRMLELLGVRTVSDFATMPRAGLASRFGREAAELSACVWGEVEAAWPGFHPLEKVSERAEIQDLETSCGKWMNLETLSFVLKGTIDRAMSRLKGRDERASSIAIHLQLEKWSTLKKAERTFRVELPIGQGSSAGLLPILQDKLGFELAREPLAAPVEAVTLEILETMPGRGLQRDFFHRKEERAEAWDSLVGRLAQKLGRKRVFTAEAVDRYLPERAWVRTLSSDQRRALAPALALSGEAQRPARVLEKPEPLARDGSQLVHLSGKRWKVMSWDGPERLSGEWWRDQRKSEGFHRDYYRVATETGEWLWVFLNRKAKVPTFYLQGYFD